MNRLDTPVPASTGAPFPEGDFEQLASALDQIVPAQRELFLAKLVILLSAGSPAGTLADRLRRARKHLNSDNKETT